MKQLLLLSLLATGVAAAQNPDNPCNAAPGAKVPDGCFPLTYHPADGSPDRPVFLKFTPGPEPTQVGIPSKSTNAAGLKLRELDLGVDAAYSEPDYGGSSNINVGAFVTYTGRRFGGEANVDYTAIPRREKSENTFFAGPRFNLVSTSRMVVYVKAQYGLGHFHGDPFNPSANGKNYFVQAYGAGIDLHATRHLNVRLADGEYQLWSSFPANGLTPYSIGSGLSYRF